MTKKERDEILRLLENIQSDLFNNLPGKSETKDFVDECIERIRTIIKAE